MTNLTKYEKGCSPSAIQRKYSLTYEQGYELAERLKKTQELEAQNAQLKTEYEKECHRADELEDSYWKAEKINAQLKELLKEVLRHELSLKEISELTRKISEVLK